MRDNARVRSIGRSVRHRLIGDRDVAADPVDDGQCVHLREAAVSDADVESERLCQGCAEDGEQHWAHLRQCLSCGYIGCCDSSPRRHATAHHMSTHHPVMRSAEPGESWRWCYVDAQIG